MPRNFELEDLELDLKLAEIEFDKARELWNLIKDSNVVPDILRIKRHAKAMAALCVVEKAKLKIDQLNARR